MGFPFFQGYIVVRQNKCSEDRPLGKMKYILKMIKKIKKAFRENYYSIRT